MRPLATAYLSAVRGAQGVISKRYPLNYAMNFGRNEVIHEEGGPPHMEGHVNEHAQFWHYRNWAHWMAAESWADLRAIHPQVPQDRA